MLAVGHHTSGVNRIPRVDWKPYGGGPGTCVFSLGRLCA